MPLPLTDITLQTLRSYLREIKNTPSEIGKRERFSSLLGTLFGDSREVGLYSRGAETSLRIKTSLKEKRGRADTLYGSAVVEFERDLKHSLTEAEQQLCEYSAGIWQQDSAWRNLDAVATDGVCWKIYRPVLPEGALLQSESIVLELRREITLKDDESLHDFYRWLNLFLFRESHLEPTSENIQHDFGSFSHTFFDGMAGLRRAWVKARSQSEAALAFDTWQRYLAVTYGQLNESVKLERDRETGVNISQLDDLFLRHTWLVSISRLMVWAALSGGQTGVSLRQVARDVFSGSWFQSKYLANLTDDDFFHWIRVSAIEEILAPVWERILDTLLTYDLSRMKEDVLKGIYQQLIDPVNRHELGEYYTPDWLCERIAAEMLPAEGYKNVLDPSCGSGSFLRATIHHYLAHNTFGSDNDKLRAVLKSVQGIDIHPVAVTIARANYVLALGKLVKAARRPIQIPIFLADALFLPREVEKDLVEQLSGIEIRFGPKRNKLFVLPAMIVNQPESFDDAMAAATRIAERHAETGEESRERLDTYLRQAVPALSEMLGREDVLSSLWEFTVGLSDLIRQKQNSIWSFIIRNSYRPAMLRQQFDIILGNPPWVAYRYVTDPEYQKEIKKRAIETYAIAPRSQKLFTQMELATVFLAHSLSTFARDGCKLAFVMPRSVLTADQHQNLIQRKYSAPFRITGYWDLWDVAPLFNVPCCVLFTERSERRGTVNEVTPAQLWTAKLPGRDLPWSRVSGNFEIEEKEARVIWLGGRSALSTEKGAASATRSSPYAKAFRQGGTIVPRNFYFVSVDNLEGAPDPDRLYPCRTDEAVALDSKKPYRDVRVSGNVEGRFLFSTALARHVLPFALLEPTPVVLPIEVSNGKYYTATPQTLRRKGFRDAADWFERTEVIWKEARGTKTSHTALEWLDYQGKLITQTPTHRHLVLYAAAGTNISATYSDRQALKLPFIVDSTLYWAAFNNALEAHFVTAIMNSNVVNQAIKPFQSFGLLGPRHVHKKLLEVPFPLYDETNTHHRGLGELSIHAHRQAQAAIADARFRPSASLALKRAYIRTAVEDSLKKINHLVTALLGL